MRISTTQMHRHGITAIQRQQSELSRTQEQIATGKRILKPSDDPAGAKRLLDLDQSLTLTRQYLRNADTADNRLSLEESSLDGVVNVLQRTREIAIQAQNPTLNESDRQALAAEVRARLDELLGLANTKDGNNEYVFAGQSTQTRPFSAAPGGGFAYHGDQGSRELQIAPGYMVPIGDSGSDVFLDIRNGNGTYMTLDDPANTGDGILDSGTVVDSSAWVPDDYTLTFTSATAYEVRDGGGALVVGGTYVSGEPIAFAGIELSVEGTVATGDRFTVSPSVAQSVFETIDDLAAALEAPVTDGADGARLTNALSRAIGDLDLSMTNVDSTRARIGARLNAVDGERGVNEGFELHLQELYSQIQDLDLAEAISRLTLQTTSLEAAQSSFAKIQDLSLFDYIR